MNFTRGLLLAPPNGIAAQLFHLREKRLAGLLAQHRAQQHAQRAHIAPQGRFFFIGGVGQQLAKAGAPAFRLPQQRDGFHAVDYRLVSSWPALSAMQDATNLNRFIADTVNGQVREWRKEELSCVSHSPCSARIGVVGQQPDFAKDKARNAPRSFLIVQRNVLDHILKIIQCFGRPAKVHQSPKTLAARASASSCVKEAPASSEAKP